MTDDAQLLLRHLPNANYAQAHVVEKVALIADCRIETVSENRVIAVIGSRRFLFSGPVFRDILPLLDGSQSADSVVSLLSSKHTPNITWLALEQLRARQLLTAVTEAAADRSPLSFTKGGMNEFHVEEVAIPAGFYLYRGRCLPPDPSLPLIGIAGFGRSEEEALAKCKSEAIERVSGFLHPGVERITARKSDLDGSAWDPLALLNFSEYQYANRQRLNRSKGDMDRIPARFDETVAIDWSPARHLWTDQPCWIPTALGYFSANPIVGSEFGVADSNGCAAGQGFEQACLSALLELIERDACAIWWYNQMIRPVIDLRSFGDARLVELSDFVKLAGRSLSILDLTHDIGIPVVAAISWPEQSFVTPRIGLGIAFDLKEATTKAIGELISQSPHLPDRQRGIEEHIVSRPPTHVLGGAPSTLWANTPPIVNPMISQAEKLAKVFDLLKQKGFECAVMDQTLPRYDRTCVRVIVPGLRSLAGRFGPGRLFGVPRPANVPHTGYAGHLARNKTFCDVFMSGSNES